MSGRMLPVRLPVGFDPRRDRGKLEAKVRELKGEEWSLTSVDVEAGKAYFVSADAVTSIIERDGRKGAQLPADVKPSDGAKQAVLLAEAFDLRYPGQGWVMTVFDPYLRQAVMERLSPSELRAREALATALGVKPWQVQVHEVDGGFDVRLPATYSPSRHDTRINETITTAIGTPGWYVETDVRALTMRIRAGELPDFPAVEPYPFDIPPSDVWSLPVGIGLGAPGSPNHPVSIDLGGVPGILSTGTSGSGKSVGINNIITSALLRGWELAIANVPHKVVDFSWCKEFCRPGGWGFDSKRHALTVIELVYQRGQEIARLLKSHDVQKVNDLPAAARPRPVLLVIDEATALFALEPLPKGIPRDHPLVQEAVAANLVTQTLIKRLSAVLAEMRFTGVRVMVSTQMAQAKTGFDGPLKANLSHRILWGAAPSQAARGFALANPQNVPHVPEWIQTDEKSSRGTGVVELDGSASDVIKGYFSRTEEMRKRLLSAGVPRCECPEPTEAQVATYTPSLQDTTDCEPAPSRLETENGFGGTGGKPKELKGAARASHELAMSAVAKKAAPRRASGEEKRS